MRRALVEKIFDRHGVTSFYHEGHRITVQWAPVGMYAHDYDTGRDYQSTDEPAWVVWIDGTEAGKINDHYGYASAGRTFTRFGGEPERYEYGCVVFWNQGTVWRQHHRCGLTVLDAVEFLVARWLEGPPS